MKKIVKAILIFIGIVIGLVSIGGYASGDYVTASMIVMFGLIPIYMAFRIKTTNRVTSKRTKQKRKNIRKKPGNKKVIKGGASCPYCSSGLGKRKRPWLRSKLKCPCCGGIVFAEPRQYIYSNRYLTEEQKGHVEFLRHLERWRFTNGSRRDYNKVYKRLKKQFKGKPRVRDVIWGLMNENVLNLSQRGLNPGLVDLRILMDQFLEFEEAMKRKRKARKKK